MKKFADIMTELKAARATLSEMEEKGKDLKRKADSTVSRFCAAKHANDPENAATMAELKKADNAEKDLRAARIHQKMLIAYLKNNAVLALAAETVPAMCDVLNRYKGKSYGPKTREKISEAVKAATGCSCYVGYNYGTEYIRLWHDASRTELELHGKYNGGNQVHILSDDNKVQEVHPDNLSLSGVREKYYPDPATAVDNALDLWEKARKAQKAAMDAASAFNAVSVDGAGCCNWRESIYDTPIY